MAKSKKKSVAQKKSSGIPMYAIGIGIAVIAAILVLLAPNSVSLNPEFEITKSDVIASNLNAKDMTFFGAKLGDTRDSVIKNLGKPDYAKAYSGYVENLEYSTKFDMADVGLLFHLENGIVTSIVVKQPFNKYLQGDTMIDWTKDEMLQRFGSADSAEVQYPFKIYTYNDRGIKFIIDRKEQNGWVFFL
ncbi:MAG TPA: hypothetical protein VJC07_00375 [Candidatus Nanoarchaeia archaeon]|nr:hypothetical protein [Candidatus Nanoarchaeia archaeon]